MASFWDQFTIGTNPPPGGTGFLDYQLGINPPTQNITRFPIGIQPVQPGVRNPGAPPVPMQPITMPGSAPPAGNVRHLGYGTGGPTGMYNTPFVRDYISPLLPEGEFQIQLGRQGLNENLTRRGQFAQSRFGDVQRKYQMAQLHNPALSFRDFLRKEGGAKSILSDWRGMTASQRGLNAPSRSSVVRWG